MKKLLSTARTTEVGDTAKRMLDLYAAEASLAAEPFLSVKFGELQTVGARMTEAIRRDKALSDLEDADVVRDAAISDLFAIMAGYAVRKNEQMRQSALRLQKILNNYGLKMAHENYTAESQLVESLLTDLSAPAATADIAALDGVDEAIAEIRSAQTDFASRRLNYERDASASKTADFATKLKKPMLQLINDNILTYLDTMQMVDAGKFGSFAAAIEKIVADTNTAVKQRTKDGKEGDSGKDGAAK